MIMAEIMYMFEMRNEILNTIHILKDRLYFCYWFLSYSVS